MPDLLFRYWGKAKPDREDGPQYHPLPYHCLDVAAVGQSWWDKSPFIRRAFAQDAPEDHARAWVLFFLALHDLGKFDIRFQLKARNALESLRPDFDFSAVSTRDSESYYHGPAGYAWFAQGYQAIFGIPQIKNRTHFECWKEWLAAVAGHHGIVPRDGQGSTIDGRFATETVKAHDRSARLEWFKALEELFLTPAGFSLQDIPLPASPLLAGFCAVCDWLGSNAEPGFFEYDDKRHDILQDYWELRLPIAEKALAMTGLVQAPLHTGGFTTLYEFKPREVQTLIDDLSPTPSLTLIEAPTGSGKTETALAYASRLLAAGLAENMIFALPTQATANAMLTRLEQVAGILFPEAANVILAHGKARYNPHFDALKQQAKHMTAQGKESATMHCAEWLAQSRKRVFLGQIGVCTVDQVLLSVLPVKHAFVRGFGLGKSMLIVDEVHAYDSYMYGLLAEVLQRQRETGGSAILLSATLPYHQRQMLAQSWGGDVEQTADYPLITQISVNGQRAPSPVLPEQEKPDERTVKLALYSAPDMLPDAVLLEEILAAARVGAKVAVICNLVADAQSVAQRLREQTTIPVDIFHSRYRFLDRQDKEEEVLQRYGKKRKAGGRILVATQVVEQSLDLDFDWMVTQLCPMDLLFQRLGRLHRHKRQRPNGFESPRCIVLTADKDNYGGSEAIYCKAILWRTQQLLQEHTELLFPNVYRPLIEQVYDEAPWKNEPEAITEALNEHLGRAMANRHEALRLVRTAINPFDDEDEKVTVLTRAGEMNLNVLLTTEDGQSSLSVLEAQLDQLEDWEQAEIVALHSVPVPASWRNDLPPAKDGPIRLPMHETENGLLRGETHTAHYIYSQDFGLIKEKK